APTADTGREHLAADPAALGDAAAGLTEREKARRERVREQAGGIVTFATDAALTMAAFVLAGQVYVAELTGGAAAGARALGTLPPAFDAPPAPPGRRAAYVWRGA